MLANVLYLALGFVFGAGFGLLSCGVLMGGILREAEAQRRERADREPEPQPLEWRSSPLTVTGYWPTRES